MSCRRYVSNPTDVFNQVIVSLKEAIVHEVGVIVQGRYDIICPMTNAWGLHRAWPEARFEIILDAGHASIEPGIIDALVRATDSFRET